jgi:spore maturation protein CgeB
MNIVVLGLSITSASGNGHASTYRSLLAALHRRGHRIVFLEREMSWYAGHRDLPQPEYARVVLYSSLAELTCCAGDDIADADLVMVGSYVPEGPEVIDLVLSHSRGVTAFYDIDTPITMAMLASAREGYIHASQISCFDLYLSFSGGPVLADLEAVYGAARARPLYCSVDSHACAPAPQAVRWHLGYLGTYSADRQPGLELRLIEAARQWPNGRFVVAGAQYPAANTWPANVERIEHVPPDGHARFFGAQRFTLNLTSADMTQCGYSPGVRLLEAAACGVPIVSDPWPGLETFFVPGDEILVSRSTRETLEYLVDLPDVARDQIAASARARVLAEHTSHHRALELESYVAECR